MKTGALIENQFIYVICCQTTEVWHHEILKERTDIHPQAMLVGKDVVGVFSRLVDARESVQNLQRMNVNMHKSFVILETQLNFLFPANMEAVQ
jgi:hypothetical protein